MTSRRWMRRPPRGMTFIEAIGTMAVLTIGLAGVASVIGFSGNISRRNLAQAQAQAIAEQQLEAIRAMGCDPSDTANPCARIQALDGTSSQVYWGAAGEPTTAATPGTRRYDVSVDVDPPFEGTETGSPGVRRALPNAGAAGNTVNVRVSVGWDEGDQRRFFALQTRMGP